MTSITARRDNAGFTLIEVMVAMVILMVGMLALLNTAAVIISNNMQNVIRDEAVRVAQETMDEKRNSALSAHGWDNPCPTVTRNMRSGSFTYTVCSRVAALSSDSNTMQIDIAVGWNYKGTTPTVAPTGTKYQHSLSSIIRTGS